MGRANGPHADHSAARCRLKEHEDFGNLEDSVWWCQAGCYEESSRQPRHKGPQQCCLRFRVERRKLA